MEINQKKSIIEAILFAAGRPVKKSEMVLALEITEEDIENLVQKMQEEFNSLPQNIFAYLYPSIRKCHFEVDKDVKEQFENEFKDINISNSIEIMDKQLNKEKWNIDTVLINKILLKKEGLIEENIIDSGICSMCNSDIIHSFRVEKENYGLETALICLK